MKLFMSKKGRKDKKDELQESNYLQLNYVTVASLVASLNATTYLTSFWNNTYLISDGQTKAGSSSGPRGIAQITRYPC